MVRVFDPKHLMPNLNYMIPEDAAGKELITYVVKNGDTLAKLSEKFGVMEEIIMEENHLDYFLPTGKEIIIYKSDKSLVF